MPECYPISMEDWRERRASRMYRLVVLLAKILLRQWTNECPQRPEAKDVSELALALDELREG